MRGLSDAINKDIKIGAQSAEAAMSGLSDAINKDIKIGAQSAEAAMSGLSDAINKDIKIGAQSAEAAMSGLSDGINRDIKISAQGGAEVALDEHDAETRAHHERVESLLSEIRDALKNNGGQTSQAAQKTNQYVPSWRPESMFSDKSETF
jgi:hypothetical protein